LPNENAECRENQGKKPGGKKFSAVTGPMAGDAPSPSKVNGWLSVVSGKANQSFPDVTPLHSPWV
jgi:hypothetical protein